MNGEQAPGTTQRDPFEKFNLETMIKSKCLCGQCEDLVEIPEFGEMTIKIKRKPDGSVVILKDVKQLAHQEVFAIAKELIIEYAG